MTIPIKRFINLSITEPALAVGPPNPNVVALLTSDDGDGILSSLNRTRSYTSAREVEEAFGTASPVTKAAGIVFSQSPNPADGGGNLVVGYWRSGEETVPATPATLASDELDTTLVVSQLQDVSDGSFLVSVDGTEETVTGLDFSTVTSLGDIAGIIEGGINPADPDPAIVSVYVDGSQIVVETEGTGSTATLTYFSAASTGTFIGNILSLSEGSGADLQQGEDSDTLTAETKLEAASACRDAAFFAGMAFVDPTSDSEKTDLAGWSSERDVLVYDVFSSGLTVGSGTPWEIRQAAHRDFRMSYSKKGNRALAYAQMGRMHSVQLQAENTMPTLHLKVLTGVTPEEYTSSELDAAETIGLDVYSTVSNAPSLIASSGNSFTDERYILLAFQLLAETRLFNVLRSATTRVPQTTDGGDALLEAGRAVTETFVTNGSMAPGEWTSTEILGDRDNFLETIRVQGYYWQIQPFDEQAQADREARKAPPLQVAFKLAGAIHSADVIVQFNR